MPDPPIALSDQLILPLGVVADDLLETSASRATSLTATCSYPRSTNSRAAVSAMTWRVWGFLRSRKKALRHRLAARTGGRTAVMTSMAQGASRTAHLLALMKKGDDAFNDRDFAAVDPDM